MSEQAELKAGLPPAMKDWLRLRKRVPLPKHHEEKADAPKVVESEEKEKPKTVVISEAQVKENEVFSPEAARAIHERPVPTHNHDPEKDEIDIDRRESLFAEMNKDTVNSEAVTDGDAGNTNKAIKRLLVSGKTKEKKEKQTKLKGIPHLEDAYHAGTSKSIDCTLIQTGVTCEGASISEGRKAGMDVIVMLCRKFNAHRLEKEMLDTFKLQKRWQPVTAVAAAVFIFLYRREQPISLKQILPLLVTPPVNLSLLGVALKRVEQYHKEKLPAPPQLTTESTWGAGASCSISKIVHHARSVLPDLQIQDPFTSSVEITERVYNITNKIVTVFERRTKHSFERRIITIAAGFLAWQSCHYHDKHYNSQVPFTELRETTDKSDFQKYLALTKLDIDDVTARHIKRSVSLISKELLLLFQHMTWIEKTRKCSSDIPKYLELIFQFQEMIIETLNQEEETERMKQPIVAPIFQRELTAEEEAILDAPELSEKDLPDAELSKYLRSELELNAVNSFGKLEAAAMLITNAGPSIKELKVSTPPASKAKRAPIKLKEVPKSERGRGGEVEQTPELAKVDPEPPRTKNKDKAPEMSETKGKGKAPLQSLKRFGKCNNEVALSTMSVEKMKITVDSTSADEENSAAAAKFATSADGSRKKEKWEVATPPTIRGKRAPAKLKEVPKSDRVTRSCKKNSVNKAM